MKRGRWFHLIDSIIMIIITIFAFIAGYYVTAQIFVTTGKPGDVVAYIITSVISVFLMLVVWNVYVYIHRKVAHGKAGNGPFRTELLEITFKAMDKIAQGDFDIFIDSNKRDPYNELAESVNRMAKELGSVEKLRQDFISDVSHEIQSPLTSIKGFAGLLKKGGLDAKEVTHFADIIETESHRLSKLSDNLLRLSVLEADTETLEVKPFRLDKQIESVILMLEPQWSEKNILPEIVLPKVMLSGNEDLLSQVWINLIHNAIKFTPLNGVIRVTLSVNKNSLACSILDNGPGIAPENQIHIFERFYKVDKSRDRALGGNGLGLSLVKKIVERHGGEVIVKSEIDKGAEFIVTLPNKN